MVGALIQMTNSTELSSDPPRRVAGLAPNQPEWRVLIADDNAQNRSLLLHLLSPIGFKLQEAVDGQHAIALWQAWKPNAILMDLRMPVMDGYEAMLKIRQTEQGKNTVIIAITAEDYERRAIAAGFDDYIQKPFRIQTVLLKLAVHLSIQYI